jgi:hypothetical protein
MELPILPWHISPSAMAFMAPLADEALLGPVQHAAFDGAI